MMRPYHQALLRRTHLARAAILRISAVAAAVALALSLVIALGSPRAARAASETSADAAAKVTIYTCSMHPQVMQDKPGYCPICGMKLVPIRQEATQTEKSAPEQAAKKERKILYYWDPMMNPPYVSDKPGKSPMGMDLVPVYEDEVRAGPTVIIDPVVTQNMGIRVAEVRRGPLRTKIRTVGYFRAAEPNQYDIALKVGGYIEGLAANTEGMLVKKGTPLFALYSPDLLGAEEELLAAKRGLDQLPANADQALRTESQALVENARRKLELWNGAAEDIDALIQSGKASRTVTFRSPVTGFIIEKNVVEGSSVMAGERLFRIVDQSTLWLDAQIYENQLPLVKVGQKAVAGVQGLAEKSIAGEVVFINPQVNAETRAVEARIAFPNPEFLLKPGMYATVEIEIDVAPDATQVPREAVIDTGRRQIVFVSLGEGRFDPRAVRTGTETTDGTVQILEGLVPGETVVTSGQFLLDTESRTREAIQKMTEERLLRPSAQAEAEKHAALSAEQATPVTGGATDLTYDVDAIVKEYLEMGRLLAADRPVEHSAIQALSKAAEAVVTKVGKGALEPIAKGVLDNANAMHQPNIEDQRRQFRTLSDYVIKLMDHAAPSKAVGSKLYVVHCPMYPGDWLQADQPVRNPFYGKSMLECGEIARTIALKGTN